MRSKPLRWPGVLAALAGFLGVILLSCSAHGEPDEAIANWLNTAGLVAILHALATLVALNRGSWLSAILMLAGSYLFAGSLSLMSYVPAWHIPGMAPVGGLCLLSGWLTLAWHEARAIAP